MRSLAAGLALLAAAGVFLPAGASGLAALLWLGASLAGLIVGRWRLRREGLPWLLAWALWMLASAAWTVAPMAEWPRHASHVAIVVTAPVLAASIEPALAARALRLFVASAVVLAGAWFWHAWRPWPVGGVLSSMVHYAGNKAIANGLLMALAAALALHFGLRSKGRVRQAWWAVACVLLAAVLARSASRTAHGVLLVLPLLLAWWRWRSPHRRRLAVGLVGAGALASWLWFAPGHSIDGWGGAGGLAARGAAGQLQESDANRAVLYRTTLALVAERPLVGHGLGAWATLWSREVDAGRAPAALRSFNTAHNAPLQLAAEGGLVAVLLLLGAVAGWAGAARRAGLGAMACEGVPLALALSAFALASLVNATLRDAVFSSPMVVLLGLGLAAARPAAVDTSSPPR